jgi:ABC-type sugar transport system substrate-binding protein/DNA-binding CsgD family transcriptional regulator
MNMDSVGATLGMTERELEILRLLDKGMSDREIAGLLFLAQGTVKWHNNQIYTKLGVKRRSQAVARARELGLLTIPPTDSPASITQERPRTLVPRSHWLTSMRYRTSRREGLLVLGMVSVVAIIVTLVFLSRPTQPVFARPNVLVGVQGNPQDTQPTEDEIKLARQRAGENGMIAYIACTQASEYHATQAREMQDFAHGYGLGFRIYDSEADDYRQITLVERARTEGAVGLIVCPLNGELLQGPLSSVQEVGMPLVLFGSAGNTYGGVLLSSASDNYGMGQRAGRVVGEIIRDERGGQADVIILDFPTRTGLVDRANGLEAGVLEIAPDAQMIGRVLGATRENGYASVSQLIEDGVHFDAIVSINDAGALGAIRALDEAGIGPEEVIISSIDGEQLALEYIRSCHFMRGSLYVGRRETAQYLVNIMVRLLSSGAVPEIIVRPVGEMITQENVNLYAPVGDSTPSEADACAR